MNDLNDRFNEGGIYMLKILCVGFGGFLGASLRYLISIHSTKIFGNHFPYGTLIVNILGGLLIGIIMELSITTQAITPNMRLFLTTGILGGLTTFSTFSFETINLITEGKYILGSINICVNVFFSLCGVIIGKSVIHFF